MPSLENACHALGDQNDISPGTSTCHRVSSHDMARKSRSAAYFFVVGYRWKQSSLKPKYFTLNIFHRYIFDLSSAIKIAVPFILFHHMQQTFSYDYFQHYYTYQPYGPALILMINPCLVPWMTIISLFSIKETCPRWHL